jgi:TatD DNase family protein
MLIDTHAHLDEQAFETDLEAVLTRAHEQGVGAIFTIGVTAASSLAALQLAKQFPHIHAVVGIQPNYVAQAGLDDMDLIAGLASDPHVVAVGETGLDRYWDSSPLSLQQEYFRRHIELSRRVDKPFVVHCRDAEQDVVSLLTSEAKNGPLRGVMHSFSGDVATAQACLDLGMLISFAGMLTFKSNQALRDVARIVPLDRVLVETDSPYLAPVPLRGKRNEPANVLHTARCLAEIHGVTLDEISTLTTRNVNSLFGLTFGA